MTNSTLDQHLAQVKCASVYYPLLSSGQMNKHFDLACAGWKSTCVHAFDVVHCVYTPHLPAGLWIMSKKRKSNSLMSHMQLQLGEICPLHLIHPKSQSNGQSAYGARRPTSAVGQCYSQGHHQDNFTYRYMFCLVGESGIPYANVNVQIPHRKVLPQRSNPGSSCEATQLSTEPL